MGCGVSFKSNKDTSIFKSIIILSPTTKIQYYPQLLVIIQIQPLAFISLFAALAFAINVNYYSDGGCQNRILSLPNVPQGGSCYEYQWNGMNSADIRNCQSSECHCRFFAGPYFGNGVFKDVVIPEAQNCASNWGAGFQYFECVTS
jgi:hypothetical protein